MRGEYASDPVPTPLTSELPPHARRIPTTLDNENASLGTTSACAENTYFYYTHSIMEWNYLRMRGEYLDVALAYRFLAELPPHARRIQFGTPLGD